MDEKQQLVQLTHDLAHTFGDAVSDELKRRIDMIWERVSSQHLQKIREELENDIRSDIYQQVRDEFGDRLDNLVRCNDSLEYEVNEMNDEIKELRNFVEDLG